MNASADDPRYADMLAISENFFDDMFGKYFSDTNGWKIKRTTLRTPIPTEPIAWSVWYFRNLFRDSLHDIFRATFTIPCGDGMKFAEYAVSMCEIMWRTDFGFVADIIGGAEKIPSFRIVIVCATISELCIFCMERGCYSYIKMASKIFVVVFDRILGSSLPWEGVMDFCQIYTPAVAQDPNPNCKIAELRKHSEVTNLVGRAIERCAFQYHMEKVVLRHQDQILLSKVEKDSHRGAIGDLKCSICKTFCKYSISRFAHEIYNDYEHDCKRSRQVL